MDSKNILLVALTAALGLTICDMAINKRSMVQAARKRKRRKRGKSRRAPQAPAATVQATPKAVPQAPLRSLKAGDTMTVEAILDEIQKRDERSHFAVAATIKKELIKGNPVVGRIGSSLGVPTIPSLRSLFKREILNEQGLVIQEKSPLMNQQVTLKKDTSLANLLFKRKRLNKKTKSQYSNILLYFEHDGYRFYVVDPYPGKVRTTRGTKVNPAAKILSRW